MEYRVRYPQARHAAMERSRRAYGISRSIPTGTTRGDGALTPCPAWFGFRSTREPQGTPETRPPRNASSRPARTHGTAARAWRTPLGGDSPFDARHRVTEQDQAGVRRRA